MRNRIAKTNKFMNTNKVTLTGEIVSEFKLDHTVYGQEFYTTELAIDRFSDYTDYIPIVVSEKLIDFDTDYTGKIVSVSGEFRSYNDHENGRCKLSVYVKSIELVDGEHKILQNENNEIKLDGYICKVPVLRKTPISNIDIADIMVAVNRSYGSDYIPCICWHDRAHLASTLNTGAHVKLVGRIQSREYIKKLSETEQEVRVAYEVSVSKLELV